MREKFESKITEPIPVFGCLRQKVSASRNHLMPFHSQTY